MEDEQNNLISKLANINRSHIYLVLTLLLAIPMIKPIGLPIVITEETRVFGQWVDEVPDDSIIILQFDFSSAHVEQGYESIAILSHIFSKQVKIIICSFEPEGPMMARIGLDKINKNGKIYGTDYVQLPYVPGGESAVAAFGADYRQIITQDVHGTPIEELPLMNEFKTINDCYLWISISGAGPAGGGAFPAMRQIKASYNIPVIVGASGVQMTKFYAFYQAKAIDAILMGTRAAAEYELLVGKPGTAVVITDSLSMSHLFAIVLIILGNIPVILEKIRGVK